MACQKPAANNANDSKAATNTNQAANSATPPPAVLSPPASDSPTSAYKAAYAARKNKDIVGFKKADVQRRA
ncbi:MAG: hypothetical protein IPK98_10650 [Chloracidobacterium sp.]|nr:hypothetical protein [Chloracidobacterium sp.]